MAPDVAHVSAVPGRLHGRAFYESIGSPKKILAPMVDQSELAFRLLTLRHGADLCYSPMLHSRLYCESSVYRGKIFTTRAEERSKLFVQFAANDPDVLLEAARMVEPHCAAVDINFGCPQGIAKRGHYGSYLQDDWDLVCELVHKLHTSLTIPVTAKIRIFPDRERTLAYAQRILAAGASILTVHGRTREQRGVNTGVADWGQIRYLRENLPPDTVLFANGNILDAKDFEACLRETGADGVMTADGALCNPIIFADPALPWAERHPRVDHVLEEYIEIFREYGLENDTSALVAVKSHVFKILGKFFAHNTAERNKIGTFRFTGTDGLHDVLHLVRAVIDSAVARGEITPDTDRPLPNVADEDQGVPWWRVQSGRRAPPRENTAWTVEDE